MPASSGFGDSTTPSSTAMPASSRFGDSITPRLGSSISVPTVLSSVPALATSAKPKVSGFGDNTSLGSVAQLECQPS
ncbi:hypothetical protein AAC387_Pa10g0520 [Persea americana]